jgi:hypothetical protein
MAELIPDGTKPFGFLVCFRFPFPTKSFLGINRSLPFILSAGEKDFRITLE